jgi:L-alanine-DL-glutamate epimerase-like enolase superfamily enzyme
MTRVNESTVGVAVGEALPIETVSVHSCVVPLPAPLLVGGARVAARQYDVIRIRAAGGLEGTAFAFGRGLPVGNILGDALAPLLLGADAAQPEALRARLAAAYWPYAERGLFSVALSAIDLALWDLLGQRAGLPLADLLGRRASRIPVCGVGGYVPQSAGDSLEALQADVERLAARGCGAVKIVVGAFEPAVDAERVRAVRDVVGDKVTLVADAFRSLAGLEPAVDLIRRLLPYNLSYLEDPFSDTVPRLSVELRRRTGVSVGLGENLSGRHAFRDLIESGAADVIRCDATVVGGVREFMAAACLAAAHGLPVSAHVHPAVHVHFAAALENLHPAGLEWMDPASGIDTLHELVQEELEIDGGAALVPNRPGLGLQWNWPAVERHARYRAEVTA